jgi:subtilisin family serine protease
VTASLPYGRVLALIVLLVVAGAVGAQSPSTPGTGVSQSGSRVLVMLRMRPPHFRPGGSYAGSYGDGEGRSARWRAARRVAAAHGASIVDEWPMSLLGVDCYVMAVPAGQSVDALVAQISRDPAVSWAEPMQLFHAEGEDTEPEYSDPLYRVQPAAREWRLARLHRIATGRNVRVAIIDSMVDRSQPDLAGQIDTLRNFVPGSAPAAEDHGTAVAGIIVAKPNNGVGIVGIAPQARLMALRACWQERGETRSATLCDALSVAKALEFAINHDAQVINMSLGGPDAIVLSRLIDIALARGTAVVAAYDRGAAGGGFPASYKGVIAVAAEEPDNSSAGVLAAPGKDVPTTAPGREWRVVNGSSYAAAHVSGLLALLRERTAFTKPASALVLAGLNHSIDACATLLQKSQPCGCSCPASNEVLSSIARE